MRHIFPATKRIAKTYPQIVPRLPETFQKIYDPSWFPETFVNIPEIPSKTFQKVAINHHNVEIKNYNAEIQPFSCTNNPENTNTSLEASSIENTDTLINPQHTDTRMNETTETDFNSTFLDDGTLFSSHTVNTLIDLEGNDKNNNFINNNDFNNNNITTNTTDNTQKSTQTTCELD